MYDDDVYINWTPNFEGEHHTLTAVAYDATGNRGSSETISLTLFPIFDTAVDGSSDLEEQGVEVLGVEYGSADGRVLIRFSLPYGADIVAEVYDLGGKLLTQTDPRRHHSGEGVMPLEQLPVVPGAYLVKLTARDGGRFSTAAGKLQIMQR